jgi:hypothetical protein
MTSWSLKLPMRDPDEPLDVDAITDLPAALESGSDQRVARELLSLPGSTVSRLSVSSTTGSRR